MTQKLNLTYLIFRIIFHSVMLNNCDIFKMDGTLPRKIKTVLMLARLTIWNVQNKISINTIQILIHHLKFSTWSKHSVAQYQQLHVVANMAMRQMYRHILLLIMYVSIPIPQGCYQRLAVQNYPIQQTWINNAFAGVM